MTSNTKVALSHLAYVIYEHPNLEKFKTFAEAFGLEISQEIDDTVFYRGYGRDQFVYVARQAPAGGSERFIGAGFPARTAEDFKRASQIEGVKAIDTASRPGGGKAVCIKDPNGFEMQVIWGQEERNMPPQGISSCDGGRPTINGAIDKPRKGEFTRMQEGPAMIHKLGHFGYDTDKYEETCAWYQQNFNLTPTDVLHLLGNKLEVANFHRLDLGKEYSDHHCFLVTRREKPGTFVHHSSFEVEDFDTQHMGHSWLSDHGYESVWGIGRHVHGSQIFDYWYDTSGFIVEHYADGDVVNEDTPITRAEAGHMAVWGPPVPAVWGGPAKQQITA